MQFTEPAPCPTQTPSPNPITLPTGRSTLTPTHRTTTKATPTGNPTPTGGSIAPKVARASDKPIQLELQMITLSGALTHKHNPCALMVDAIAPSLADAVKDGLRRYTIPGLDASMCRCPQCLTRAQRGIWWIDELTRDRVVKRRIPFRFQPVIGDVAAESAGA